MLPCGPSSSQRAVGLFDAASAGLADWSEFDAEAARLSIEVRGLSREDLSALIESSTLKIPTTEHRRLHQEASDFVRWAGAGAREPWPTTAGHTSRCSPPSGGDVLSSRS
jgi:hypothetical protein